tara:strand:- start:25603 stop:25731 length:129 start_codon:yes stop_codon:yes gene_type:complete
MAKNLKKISKFIFIISIFVYILSPDDFEPDGIEIVNASIVKL